MTVKYSRMIGAGALLLALSMAACVSAVTPDGDPDGDPLFLVQKPVDGERFVMQALYEGSVKEHEGCLRLGDEPDGHTVIWPPGFSLVQREGNHVVLDDRDRTVGEIGGFFRLGGGSAPALWEGDLLPESIRQTVLDQCPGHFWIVGEVLDLD